MLGGLQVFVRFAPAASFWLGVLGSYISPTNKQLSSAEIQLFHDVPCITKQLGSEQLASLHGFQMFFSVPGHVGRSQVAANTVTF